MIISPQTRIGTAGGQETEPGEVPHDPECGLAGTFCAYGAAVAQAVGEEFHLPAQLVLTDCRVGYFTSDDLDDASARGKACGQGENNRQKDFFYRFQTFGHNYGYLCKKIQS